MQTHHTAWHTRAKRRGKMVLPHVHASRVEAKGWCQKHGTRVPDAGGSMCSHTLTPGPTRALWDTCRGRQWRTHTYTPSKRAQACQAQGACQQELAQGETCVPPRTRQQRPTIRDLVYCTWVCPGTPFNSEPIKPHRTMWPIGRPGARLPFKFEWWSAPNVQGYPPPPVHLPP